MNVFNVIMILDESGSMESLGKEPENSINSFIDRLKTSDTYKNNRILFSLYRFGTPEDITVSYKKVDIDNVPENHNYMPWGSTPLYDAIGLALTDNKYTYNGLCHIITDGCENSSRMFNREQIFDMISKMEQQYNWKFLYTGAGKDVYENSSSIGISANNTVSYDNHLPREFISMATYQEDEALTYMENCMNSLNIS